MSIKEQIRKEIERRLKAIANSPSDGGEMDAINGARCLELMSFRKYIDTLPEQTASDFCKENCKGYRETGKCFIDGPCLVEQPASKELEKAAKEYATTWHKRPDGSLWKCLFPAGAIRDFIAGAEWQREQMMDEWLKDRDGCFWDGVEEGKKAMEKQMMEEAMEGEICGRVYDHINVRFADGVCKYLEPKNISHIPANVSKFKVGDKVRVIVIKEEQK